MVDAGDHHIDRIDANYVEKPESDAVRRGTGYRPGEASVTKRDLFRPQGFVKGDRVTGGGSGSVRGAYRYVMACRFQCHFEGKKARGEHPIVVGEQKA